jgi:sterol desaturase/sphingolipid hydroxylase (fatty acid hydroxylase superfamily)
MFLYLAGKPWTSLAFSMQGYFAYFLLNYILNIYGHLNVEFVPPGFLNTIPGKIINTTTYHALHHARYRGHYGLFTQVLDRAHGTWFPDYAKIHSIEASPKIPATPRAAV